MAFGTALCSSQKTEDTVWKLANAQACWCSTKLNQNGLFQITMSIYSTDTERGH